MVAWARVNHSPKYIWITNDIRFVYWRACFSFRISLFGVDRRAFGSPSVIQWGLIGRMTLVFATLYTKLLIFSQLGSARPVFSKEGNVLLNILRLIYNFERTCVFLKVKRLQVQATVFLQDRWTKVMQTNKGLMKTRV